MFLRQPGAKVIDPRTTSQRAAEEARARTARAVALLAKVDAELRRRKYDILWEQRRGANPWRPSSFPFTQREPFE